MHVLSRRLLYNRNKPIPREKERDPVDADDNEIRFYPFIVFAHNYISFTTWRTLISLQNYRYKGFESCSKP